MNDENPVSGEGFDRDAFDEMLMVFPPETIGLFAAAIDEKLDRLHATDIGDRQAIAGLAHQLISSAGLLGLRRMSELAEKLETACRKDDEIRPLLEAMEQEQVIARALLEELLSEREPRQAS